MTIDQARSMIKTVSGIDVIAGIWLVIAPFVLGFASMPGAVWNTVIAGIVIVILAGARTVGDGYRVAWPSWVNFLIGLWLLIAPASLGYASSPTPYWNSIIMGIVVAVLAIWSALSTPHPQMQSHA